MKHFLTNFLRMGSTVSTPPIRLKMRSVLLVLGLLLGSMSVWGATATLQIESGVTQNKNLTDDASNTWAVSSDGNYTSNNSYIQCGTNNKPVTYIRLTTSAYGSYNISKIQVWGTSKASSNVTAKVFIGSTKIGESESAYSSQNASSGGTELSVTNTNGIKGDITIEISRPSSANGAIYFNKLIVTYEEDDDPGSLDPTVNVSPASWDFGTVHASDAASKVFSVSGSNLTEGNLTLTVPEGFSVYPSSIAVNGTLNATNVTVSKNTTTEDNYAGNLSISDGGLESAKTVALTMTVDADPEPTGTFKLFSGDIEEGDYVIYYDGKALQASVTSDRWGCIGVTPSDNKIQNPDASVVWHIAASGENWTLYNAGTERYAASTGAKNKGALIEDGTDDKAIWSVSGTYDFINVARSTGTDPNNKYLRYNSQNADNTSWACYANGTGGPLTLYKKDDGKPAAPTFSPASGSYLDAQNVTLGAEDGTEIRYTLDGSTPTSTSTLYSDAIAVSSTTTIKAIAIKAGVSSASASATYTITTPLTVAQAIALIPNQNNQVDDQYVEGYVCTAAPEVLTGDKMTYYISADGSETNRLQIYKGKNLNNTAFTATTDLAIGDKVVVFGQLKNFQGNPEMNDGNYIKRYTAKGTITSVVVSGTPTKTAYIASDNIFAPAGLVVTATYASGYSAVVTEGITWGDDLTDHKVAESGTVHVTATVGGITSSAYSVNVEFSSKTLVSIALSYDAVEVYQGLELPKPTVTATYSEGEPEDVTALAEFTGYDKTTTGEQEITVSYTFGGETKNANYTVTVKPIYNVELAASVAKTLIETVVGNTESTSDMIVRGIVSKVENISSGTLIYYISDDGTTTNHLEIYKGKYLENADFTDANKLKVGDEVVVTGKVIFYNNSTAEFASGKSSVTSLARTPNFEIEAVTDFEVGTVDLAVEDLTITRDGEGEVTLASSNNTDAVTIVDGKLHAVKAGTAIITANLAADGIYKAKTTTFDVTVIAAQVKYAITFDGNGADGGSAPDEIANKAAGAEVTLPENAWTKAGNTFSGWKVFYVDGESVEHEVTVTAGAFIMPAFAVTIKAQWAEVSKWATTYTSNVKIASDENKKVIISEIDYDAVKANKASKATITLPQGVTTIHLHLAAWNGDNGSTVTVSSDCFNENKVLTLSDDEGVQSTGNYTLAGNAYEYYFSLTPDKEVTADEVITITAAAGKRFVLFGVNQEGGVVPELQSIAISGDLTNKTGYKAGDALDMTGLTVKATYTLGGTPQTPVDITDDVELAWSYDPLVVNQTSVTITASYKGQTDDIEITGLEPVASADPLIITDPTTYLNWGTIIKDATAPTKTITVTLQNVTAATAALGGTNPTAFTIDDTEIADGDVITVSVASTATEGTYSAKVILTDNAGFAPNKEINLSLTIEDAETPVSTTSKWVAATGADLVDGAEVLITGVKESTTYAMGADRGNNRGAVAATVDGEGVLTPGEGTMSFVLVAQGDGTFALRTSNGKYLYAAGSSNNNHLKTRATIENGDAKWALTATSVIANGDNTNETVRFNSGNNPKIFSCYADESKQSAIALYVPQPAPEPVYEAVRSGLVTNRYYTVCLDKAVSAVRGASFWKIENRDNAGKEVYLEEVDPTEFAAGTPFIIQATAAALEVVYDGEAATEAGTNGALRGTLVKMFYADLQAKGEHIYLLIQNAIRPIASGNYLNANRAYIDYDALTAVSSTPQGAPGKRVRSMPMQGQVATGLDELNASEAPVKVLINGELFILRGEKMYNANGQLVK